MTQPHAKITYLFHSGFAIETARHFLIFDYYQPIADHPATLSKGIITGEFLKTKAQVYVFASHNHSDHFDPVILGWAKANPDITYILSSDIRKNTGKADCRLISPYQELTDGTVFIKAFGSTDQGVSFLVEADGLSFFHAGDLNWWHWEEESKQEQAAAEAAFKAEIDRISGSNIDVAFFPVDRRLEESYARGAEYFAAQLRPKLLLPMHFGKDYGATKAFAERAKHTKIVTEEISHQGQEFIY